jgi:hypothetical protein
MRRLLAAGLLAAGMLLIGPGGTADACACGGIVSPDLDAKVTGEQALVSLDASTETIVMRLDMQSVADNAALIVPTPTPATASAAEQALFGELERLTAPRHERAAVGRTDLDEAGAAPGGAPTVVAQVQLGPLEATTLTGGDLSGVRGWLDSHGYIMRPEVSAQLDTYLQQGWSFVAMKLTGDEPLTGQLDPVRLDFASDQLVYPMRMSAAAKEVQHVTVYTLSPHRMQRTDADSSRQDVTVDYAGSIAERANDETLTELTRHNPYLTRISTTITEPVSIATDFTFGPAPTDDPFQRVIGHRDQGPDTKLWLAIAASAVVVLVAAVVTATLVVRHRHS